MGAFNVLRCMSCVGLFLSKLSSVVLLGYFTGERKVSFEQLVSLISALQVLIELI